MSSPNPVGPAAPRVRRPQRQEVRARVLEAAAAVFARDGYSKANVEQIAEHAGFSKGAVYSNFANKQELFFALLDEHISLRQELASNSVSNSKTAVDVARHLRDLAVDDPTWMPLVFEFWSHAVRDQAVLNRFQERRAELRSHVAQAVAAQAADGRLTPRLSAEKTAMAIIALTNGLAMEIVDGQPGQELLVDVLPLLFES